MTMVAQALVVFSTVAIAVMSVYPSVCPFDIPVIRAQTVQDNETLFAPHDISFSEGARV